MDNKKDIVLASGCFDLIHLGSGELLKYASTLGNLIVGINSDLSVKTLKGPSRPINNQEKRKRFLLLFNFVKEVIIFDELNTCNLLRQVKPKYWVKGGDWNLQNMNKEELAVANELGVKIKFFPYLEGISTTNILKKINE